MRTVLAHVSKLIRRYKGADHSALAPPDTLNQRNVGKLKYETL